MIWPLGGFDIGCSLLQWRCEWPKGFLSYCPVSTDPWQKRRYWNGISNINLSIKMKQNRCQESEKDKNYKLCDELMSDISALLVEQQLIEWALYTKEKKTNHTGITVDDLVPLLIWICLVHHIQVLCLICLVQCQNKQTTLFSLTLFIRASLQHNCYCVRQRVAKYNHTIYF